jgi:hypothetical protein
MLETVNEIALTVRAGTHQCKARPSRREEGFGWKRFALAAALVAGSTAAHSADQWQTSTVKHVYPLASGDFVIVLTVDPAQCTATGPGKYLYVAVNENGMTIDGRKAMLAVALQALATRGQISVAYDDSTPSCYVNRISAWAP